jgi:hypothetical protein
MFRQMEEESFIYPEQPVSQRDLYNSESGSVQPVVHSDAEEVQAIVSRARR